MKLIKVIVTFRSSYDLLIYKDLKLLLRYFLFFNFLPKFGENKFCCHLSI